MMMRIDVGIARGALVFALPLVLAGCGFGRAEDVRFTRFFKPIAPPAERAPVRASSFAASLTVRAADHLEPRLCWQKGGLEYGYYDDWRWVEPPSRLVERALDHELFERRSMKRFTGASRVDVAVELLAFEQALEGSGSGSSAPCVVVRVAVVATTPSGERRETIEATRDLPDDSPEAFARGIAEALDEVAGKVGGFVAAG